MLFNNDHVKYFLEKRFKRPHKQFEPYQCSKQLSLSDVATYFHFVKDDKTVFVGDLQISLAAYGDGVALGSADITVLCRDAVAFDSRITVPVYTPINSPRGASAFGSFDMIYGNIIKVNAANISALLATVSFNGWLAYFDSKIVDNSLTSAAINS